MVFFRAAAFVPATVLAGPADLLRSLFSSRYLPHRYCYLQQPDLVWTNVSMDALIAISYVTIFACLFWIAGKLRSMSELRSYVWIAAAFGTFILSCAMTHMMEIVTVWLPLYPLSAGVKVVCAVASVVSAILFARATPMLADNMGRSMQMLTSTREEKDRALAALIASEKLAAAGRISASISHEIRNPLDSVGNLLFLLAKDDRLPSDVMDIVRSAVSEVSRANGIAHNSMSLYRESKGPSRISIQSLVENVLELQEPGLVARSIALDTRLRGEDELLAYPSEVRQVIINLLTNAQQAIGAGGKILVRVQPRTVFPRADAAAANGIANAAPNVMSPRRGYSITIADTGPGIAAANRSSVFQLFFTTKGEQGTGVGLWLVRSLIEKHGGSIHFRSKTSSEPGRAGTVFSVWLPLGAQSGAGATPQSASRASGTLASQL